MEKIQLKLDDEEIQRLRLMFREELKAFGKEAQDEKYLTIAEVSRLFHPPICRPVIARLRREGVLQEHLLDGRIWFKYSQVTASIKEIKRYFNRQIKPLK